VSKAERDAAIAITRANRGVNIQLKAAWGSGLDDANAALRNNVPRPPGVSTDLLIAYRQSLIFQIDQARDETGVATSRLMLIERWLKQ
jgi:hypothetical protein